MASFFSFSRNDSDTETKTVSTEQMREWQRIKKIPPSRLLSAEFLKTKNARTVLTTIARRGQSGDEARQWFLNAIVEVLMPFAWALVTSGRLPPGYQIQDPDIVKAAARLYRKIPLLERC